MKRNRLLNELNTLLEIDRFQDYCPNGLQVEGREEVRTVATAVTASLQVINRTVEQGADLLLVHHGFFWNGEDPRVVGPKQRRLKALLGNGINLLAYHLPLDTHPELGNNAQWGRQLGCSPQGQLESAELVSWGVMDEAITLEQLSERVSAGLGGRPPLVIEGHERPIRKIGWCSGAAQDYIVQAAEEGLDAYLSGEVSERTYHEALERGISFLACGHHATERWGVQALGEWINRHHGVAYHFIDEDNPI